MQNWWLDAIDSSWDVVLLENANGVYAAWPFVKMKRMFFNVVGIPLLTKYTSPVIAYPEDQKLVNKIAYQKEVLLALEKQLPKVSQVDINLDPSITNYMSLFFKGYKATTHYTYQIRQTSDLDEVFNGFKEHVRRAIRKAQKNIEVKSAASIEDVFRLNQEVYQQQGKKVPFSKMLLQKLDAAAALNKARKIFIAYNKEEEPIASIYLVEDHEKVYYLLGGLAKKYKSSGAASLLIWRAIEYAGSVGKVFDFEGSMIPPIEQFVQSFGGEQIPYFRLNKYNSKFLACLDVFRT